VVRPGQRIRPAVRREGLFPARKQFPAARGGGGGGGGGVGGGGGGGGVGQPKGANRIRSAADIVESRGVGVN